MRSVLLIFISLALAGCARQSDRDWLYREFDVPQNVQLAAIHSSPQESASNWAHRKGLSMDGAFKFSTVQLLSYREQVDAGKAGWQPLPLPKELIAKLESHYSSDLTPKTAHGFFRCQTCHGANLLTTTRRINWDQPGQLDDFVLGILDTDSAQLDVRVRQFY